jgi:2-dehydropantoate 2-reductase
MRAKPEYDTLLAEYDGRKARMRYIIYGAGAVGGVVGGRMFQAGHDVVLICRGAHLEAIRRDGLRLRTPEEDLRLRVPAVSHPSELTFTSDDVVILTMKTQDTERALYDLQLAGGGNLPIICCQNGVDNERIAARRFDRVYAMLVALPATYLEPGEVDGEGTPVSGVLDTGCYPSGVDDLITQVAADISSSKLSARAVPDAMKLKYTKLLSNLGNALQILTGEGWGSDTFRRLHVRLREEAVACYEAAGIEHLPEAEYRASVNGRLQMAGIPGKSRGGSSTWQSLMRGHTTIEADYLNGEIVLLGRLHGVPTPLNALVRRLATEIAAAGKTSGSYTAEQLEEMAGETAAAR